MKKVIAVGQTVLDILHMDGKPIASCTGGRIANMAASLGRCGVKVEYVSECATDTVGDMVIKFLQDNHVGTASIDRFTDGQTQVSLIFRNSEGEESYSEYVNYPDSRFDVLWPRIEEGDILVFGSYFAIDDAPRRGLLELINYAKERKAVIVYLPGFQPQLCSRITRVMPNILENLELADVVIAREADMVKIFEKANPEICYNDHIKFYAPNFIFTDGHNGVSIFSPSAREDAAMPPCEPQDSLGKDASFVAGIVYGLLKQDVRIDTLYIPNPDDFNWHDALTTGITFATDAINHHSNVITKE